MPAPPASLHSARPTRRRPHLRYEELAREAGYCSIAGVDEVGRGCLFGPVVAAAVILKPGVPIRGLADSKQLDRKTREAIAPRIRERCLAWSIAAVDAAWIDRVNIYQAARLAMEDAIRKLAVQPDYILADAMKLNLPLPQRSLIRGDCLSRSIAAASILAKVERDAWMREWAQVYPAYDLASNKGYGTPAHLRALERQGPTPIHRLSFEPVAAASKFPANIATVGGVLQGELFEFEAAAL
ncbi:MAG: ribonuclease HII [Acidobacteria bacterium]|nr:ribonuclease HII [Acidobacteriota bacterium]MDA1235248.1 ribonuclease HII [Acidobacteriota bacterium]